MTSRSPSPSSARPTCARTPGTVSCSSSGAIEPQPSLMLRPFGEQPIGHDLGAEIRENARPHLVGGAIGAIDDDLEARDPSPAAASTRRNPGTSVRDLSTRVARPRLREVRVTAALLHLRLDALFELIGELRAGGVEELDAVVVVEIVRRADDDAEVAVESARHVRDAGRGQRPDEHRVRRPRRRRPASSAASNM